MQTFLPYGDFESIANCLDSKRLNKQIVECQQILNCLFGFSKGFRTHPAVKMWAGYEENLLGYMEILHVQYNKRRLDAGKDFRVHRSWMAVENYCGSRYGVPSHLYDGRIIRSHRSQLLTKDYDYYRKFDWHRGDNAVPYGDNALEYVWVISPHWKEGYEA